VPRRIDLLDDEDWIGESDRPGFGWRRKRLAGENLGASLYELPPGKRLFPYHYEIGNDELLVVVAGRPTLRDPEGEHELEPGACVFFPTGPEGAHQLLNRSDEPARVLLVSNFALPRGAAYPDSGKLMFRWDDGPDDRKVFRLDEAVDYWEGED
jgi:uncharacterized cupin superfamily protein